MTTPIIEAEGLTKSYGEVQALAGLDLIAQPGQVVAVLGPNGAGKTTFVSTVATLLRPDSGTLHVGGVDVLRDPRQVRRIIGLAGQYAAVEEAMTGRENLVMVARLFGHDRHTAAANATAVLDQLGLTDAGDRLVRTYSGGMRRRLDLGASLVGRPRLLLLDEPTTGLDPRSRAELWEAIRSLVAHGTDVLLTTQYLEEADQLAHKVVIIDHGRVIADGTPDELKALGGSDVVEVHARRVEDLPALVAALAPLGERRAPGRRGGPPHHAARRGRPGRHLGRGAGRRRHRRRGRRHRPPAPHPRRGVPHDHRPAHRQRRPRVRHRRGRRGLTLSTPHPETHPMSTITPTVTVPAAHPGRLADVVAAERTAGRLTTAGQVALRTVRQFARTPQLLVVNTIQGAMFLLIFRYVFGGAIDSGPVPYVDFLVPGFVVTSVLFSGMGASAGVAEDVEKGFFDRLRSLPVSRPALLGGRALADTALLTWGLLDHDGRRVPHRVPHPRQRRPGAGRVRAVRRLRLRLHLAVHVHRPRRRQRPGRAGHVAAGLPADLRVERLRPGRLDARLAPAGGRAPAAHDHDQRGAVAGPRRPRPRRARPFDRALGRALAACGRRGWWPCSPRWRWPATGAPDHLDCRMGGPWFATGDRPFASSPANARSCRRAGPG